jgi:hypothetical protein
VTSLKPQLKKYPRSRQINEGAVPEAAVKEAEAECKRIWDKWRERRLI